MLIPNPKNLESILFINFQANESILGQQFILFGGEESVLFI